MRALLTSSLPPLRSLTQGKPSPLPYYLLHPRPVLVTGKEHASTGKTALCTACVFPVLPGLQSNNIWRCFSSSWARVWEPWPGQRGISLSRVSVHYLSRPRRYLSAHPPLHSLTHTHALPPSSAPHRCVLPLAFIDTSNYGRLAADLPEAVRATQVLGA